MVGPNLKYGHGTSILFICSIDMGYHSDRKEFSPIEGAKFFVASSGKQTVANGSR